MRFKEWMEAVNALFEDAYNGLSSDDFPDYLWYENYQHGKTPLQVFKQWKTYASY